MAPSQYRKSLFPSPCFLWSLALVFLLPTSSDACGKPPTFENMELVGSPKARYDVGERVDYECKQGYKRRLSLPTSITCAADGTWPPLSKDACFKKSCTVQSDPVNGRVNVLNGSFEFGTQIEFVCNEGFYLIGKKILRCLLRGSDVYWSDDVPLCEKILCDSPPNIKNGKYTPSEKDVFEYHEVVTYRCDRTSGPDEFSLVGESKLYCAGRRQWSSDPPECKVVKCPYPVIENGRLTAGFGKKYSYKATVMLACNKGFFLHGSNTIVCDGDSTWKPPVPICSNKPPPPPPPPPSGAKPPSSSVSGCLSKDGAFDFEDLHGWIIALIVIALLELQ